jgi:hypothetical protein
LAVLPSVAGPVDSPWSNFRRIFAGMPDLSPEDRAAIAALLREVVAADRFPRSP